MRCGCEGAEPSDPAGPLHRAAAPPNEEELVDLLQRTREDSLLTEAAVHLYTIVCGGLDF